MVRRSLWSSCVSLWGINICIGSESQMVFSLVTYKNSQGKVTPDYMKQVNGFSPNTECVSEEGLTEDTDAKTERQGLGGPWGPSGREAVALPIC